MSDLPLILASQSPRRRELLAGAGLVFEILPPDDEAENARNAGETPEQYVCRLAEQKAENVARKIDRARIIACDTIVVCRGEILGKPMDRTDARRMLRFLRGTRHTVLSGLCILTLDGDQRNRTVELETTWLEMLPIADEELEAYLDSGAWQGKAGAFGYQDRHAWITIIQGSESNVVGLPMERLGKMLQNNLTQRRRDAENL